LTISLADIHAYFESLVQAGEIAEAHRIVEQLDRAKPRRAKPSQAKPSV
jgi:hypothetical protein